MVAQPIGGREREAREIVMLRKAQQVGLLLQAQRGGKPLEQITLDDYVGRPRRELVVERDHLRRTLRGELQRFCAHFDAASIPALADLFDELLAAESHLSMPFASFIKRLGRPRDGALKGSLPHSTVRIDPIHGLQTEYPEMHLVRDLSVAFGDALDLSPFVYSKRPKEEVRRLSLAAEGREAIHRHRLAQRMTLLACFNLVEAYINGLAWDFVHHDARAQQLPEKDRQLLDESDRPVSLSRKLVRVPRLIASATADPLHESRDPLRTFLLYVQPYRDSIVHASPFSAPEKFGGYEKLSKLYGLDPTVLSISVQTSLLVISEIHRAVGGDAYFPRWVEDFIREPTRRWFEWDQQPWTKREHPMFE